MKSFRYIFLGIMLGGMLLCPAAGEAQNGASVATAITTPTIEVGQDLSVVILLNLHGNLSLGGYIDLRYDPAIFACVQVDNDDLFGTSGGKLESCDSTGLLRIASMPQSMSAMVNFPMPQQYATVILKAIQPAEMTAIRFAESSQIFGTRGGDMLVTRDETATQALTITAAVGPGEPPAPAGVPEPATLMLVGVGLLVLAGCTRPWRR